MYIPSRALRSEPEDAKLDEHQLSEQEQVRNLIERWREVDLAITDALNEAKVSTNGDDDGHSPWHVM